MLTNPNDPQQAHDPGSAPKLYPVVIVGLLIVGGFFGGLGTWAALAPLSSAAVAPGVVVVESKRKTIQHLEGGIVAKILVKDGQRVKAGDKLVRLDETRARANLALLRVRLAGARALEARLATERDSKDAISFPADIQKRNTEPQIQEIMQAQLNIYNARRQAVSGQVEILQQRIKQYGKESKSLKAQIRAQGRQLGYLRDEIADVRGLIKKGLVKKPRMLALLRRQAEVEGSRNLNQASIARAGQKAGESRLMIAELKIKQINEVVGELKVTQGEIYDLLERVRAAEDVLRRVDIQAPISGTIVDLRLHTTGGIIGPGEPLMDIVPSEDRLEIEARIDPMDIDVVRVGQPAQIRLTAYNQRHRSPLVGTVTRVSADRLSDAKTGAIFYQARVRLPKDMATKFPQLTITPGMQAEVIVVTGRRTALDYFIKPMQDSFRKAFREN